MQQYTATSDIITFCKTSFLHSVNIIQCRVLLQKKLNIWIIYCIQVYKMNKHCTVHVHTTSYFSVTSSIHLKNMDINPSTFIVCTYQFSKIEAYELNIVIKRSFITFFDNCVSVLLFVVGLPLSPPPPSFAPLYPVHQDHLPPALPPLSSQGMYTEHPSTSDHAVELQPLPPRGFTRPHY